MLIRPMVNLHSHILFFVVVLSTSIFFNKPVGRVYFGVNEVCHSIICLRLRVHLKMPIKSNYNLV